MLFTRHDEKESISNRSHLFENEQTKTVILLPESAHLYFHSDRHSMFLLI